MRVQLYYTERGGVSPLHWLADYHKLCGLSMNVRFFRLFGVTLMVLTQRPVE
jgi:hypothetical protein